MLDELAGESLDGGSPPGWPPAPPGGLTPGAESGHGEVCCAASWRDLRHGARLLRLDPGFSAVAILSLALGIGANTAIFQLLDAVRLRSPAGAETPASSRDVKIVDNPTGGPAELHGGASRADDGASGSGSATSSRRFRASPRGARRG